MIAEEEQVPEQSKEMAEQSSDSMRIIPDSQNGIANESNEQIQVPFENYDNSHSAGKKRSEGKGDDSNRE